MKKISLSIILLVLFLFPLSSFNQVLIVPDDYPTIQSAINAAYGGDTVLVKPGVYIENLNFNGKNILITSLITPTRDTGYISQTIIDGNAQGPVITINNNESNATIRGFTVINGFSSHGAGIRCSHVSVRLYDLIITNNHATGTSYAGGGGIAIGYSDVIIKNVKVLNNTGYDYGGGIKIRYYCNVSIDSSEIRGNMLTATRVHGKGGGIYIDYFSKIEISNTLITNNITSFWGGGIACASQGTVILKNVTIANNTAFYGGGALYFCYDNSKAIVGNSIFFDNYPNEVFFDTGMFNSLSVFHSDVEGGYQSIYVDGDDTLNWLDKNINMMPWFDPDYHLLSNSPCIDAGTDFYVFRGDTIINRPPGTYNGAAPDMGFWESDFLLSVAPPHEPDHREFVSGVYPNPSSGKIYINLALHIPGPVKITVHDIQGKTMGILHDSFLNPGDHIISANLKDLPGSIIFIKIAGPGAVQTHKVVVR